MSQLNEGYDGIRSNRHLLCNLDILANYLVYEGKQIIM